ncbi:nuclear transport factor 2 family protein [Phenylobacterium immobile]|uniref:nuclear transport factor 2 family protein n=1 Tax=Phenylobacterium immobile TaxID=21 RepID=UPI000ADAC691|nr:nuclear transport factor 2 family protein [Phenylobacterium immobile]
MTDLEALLDLDRRRVDGCNAQDAAMMRAVLADDYVHIHTGGTFDTADSYVEGATRGDRRVEPRTLQVRIWGDSAVLIGPQVMHIKTPNGERILNMVCTQVAQRTANGWKFVSLQATALPA